jgi:hypothetical protein
MKVLEAGLTPTFPVTTEFGTVETPVFARIAKFPDAPRFTQFAPEQTAPVTEGATPLLLASLLPLHPNTIEATNMVTGHLNGLELLPYLFICFS